MTTLLRNLLHSRTVAQSHSRTATQPHSHLSKIYYSNSRVVKVFTLLTFITTFLLLTNYSTYSQPLPIIMNEYGDTLQYTWPIPDSLLCIKDEIIIKFRANALNLNKLCYDVPVQPEYPDPDLDTYNAFKNEIMNQQFHIDSIVLDPALQIAIKQQGGLYLTRITSANPCTDTLTVTRYNDTVRCENYLWMKLKLNNDTSMINMCILLTLWYQGFLELAEPNYCKHANRLDPIDTYYHGALLNGNYVEQKSLHSFYADTRRAWDFQVGNEFIKVGIIDNGIDWLNCDLGAGFGLDAKKVINGYNYLHNSMNIIANSQHGTNVAGIIGALTNGSENCPHPGVAGIAGGWYTEGKYGCKLYGFKVGDGNNIYPSDKIIAAMREGAADYTHVEYGNSVTGSYRSHILNCSYGDDVYSESERSAINFAFEQGVSIVASRGNRGTNEANYPSTYDNSWVTSVGGHDEGIPDQNVLPKRWSNTSYGKGMDLIAPSIDLSIVTTKYDISGGEPWKIFGFSSAAAAHVTGGLALLRSEFYENPNHTIPQGLTPEPEDFENIMKAAALDLNYDPTNLDLYVRTHIGYDNVSGWGQLKIGKIFEMLEEGYILKHYKITNLSLEEQYQIVEGGIVVHAEGLRRDVAQMPYPIAERRTISGSINVSDNWLVDDTHNLYVWGRNGRTMKGGFNKSNILYLTSYTEVTSGQGGNGIIPGIIHNNSFVVNAKTYQYRLNNGIELPADDNLELYISVFGKPYLVSVDENADLNTNTIYPNPASESCVIKFNLEVTCSPVIRVINNLGNVLYQEIYEFLNVGYHEKIIDISNLVSGVYFIEVQQNDKIHRNKLIITK